LVRASLSRDSGDDVGRRGDVGPRRWVLVRAGECPETRTRRRIGRRYEGSEFRAARRGETPRDLDPDPVHRASAVRDRNRDGGHRLVGGFHRHLRESMGDLDQRAHVDGHRNGGAGPHGKAGLPQTPTVQPADSHRHLRTALHRARPGFGRARAGIQPVGRLRTAADAAAP
jgi:hypothetical protein